MEYYKEAKTLVITLSGSAQTIDLGSAVYNHKAVMLVPGNNFGSILASLKFYSKGAVSSFIASTGATVDSLNVNIVQAGQLTAATANYIIPTRLSGIKIGAGTPGQTILVVLLN